jgi:hypothetical protein
LGFFWQYRAILGNRLLATVTLLDGIFFAICHDNKTGQ